MTGIVMLGLKRGATGQGSTGVGYGIASMLLLGSAFAMWKPLTEAGGPLLAVVSVRALSWLKLARAPDSAPLGEALDARLRASLAEQIETLSRNLEYRLQANHLLDNLIAVVAGGLALEGPQSARWLKRWPLLERELDDQIDADGAHCERSPMYHAIVLGHLLDLLNVARAAAARAPEGLVERLAQDCGRMIGAQRVWTHPDGRIALFGDSAFGLAAEPSQLEAYAEALGVVESGPRVAGVLGSVGFARLESRELTVIASLGGPSPPHQAGHAHCDALAFELSAGRTRIVTDTGVCEYEPGPRRDLARGTRAHATVVVDSEDQAEMWSAHRVGGRPRVRLASFEPERWAEATCIGWSTPDTRHRRQFVVVPSGLEIGDRIEWRPRPVRFALPLAPGIELDPEQVRAGCLRIPLPPYPEGPRLGNTLEWTLPGDVQWRLERGPYYPRFGTDIERAVLVGEAAHYRNSRMTFRVISS
jgi:hypothetical protein